MMNNGVAGRRRPRVHAQFGRRPLSGQAGIQCHDPIVRCRRSVVWPGVGQQPVREQDSRRKRLAPTRQRADVEFCFTPVSASSR
jgi:hypothetical protein